MSRKSSVSILIVLTIIWAAALAVVAHYDLEYSIFYVFPFSFLLIVLYIFIYRNYDLSVFRNSDLWVPPMTALAVMLISTILVCAVYQTELMIMLTLGDIALMVSIIFHLSEVIKYFGSPSKKWFLAVTAVIVALYICLLIVPVIYSTSSILIFFWPLLMLPIYSSLMQYLPK